MNLKETLIKHEALKLKPYKDSLGILTIGVGHNLERGISEAAAMFILDEDIADARREAQQFAWFYYLNDVRQNVVINMVFNIGITRFKGFKKMIAALDKGYFPLAANEMLDSKWASQVGSRATELAKIMEIGE